MEKDHCKLLILGDSTVGKTSILYQYTNNLFSSQHLATVGIDYFTKSEVINGSSVSIKIWDTAGQERYKSLTNAFFRNAEGIILVYDVTDKDTFNNLKHWLQSINSCTSENSGLKKIVIGNKIDLKREVSQSDAEEFANENNVKYFESSAKQNINISESIRYLTESVIESPEYKEMKKKRAITLNQPKQNTDKDKEKRCC